MDTKTRADIIAIIDATDDMTIATMREDGFPQATTVSYVNDGLKIYFGTVADGQKARNIAQNNKVSLTINRPYDNWGEITGLSMGAIATPVTEPEEFDKVGGLLFQKFPQIPEYTSTETDTLTLFRIDPVVISLLDYRKGFGFCEMVEV